MEDVCRIVCALISGNSYGYTIPFGRKRNSAVRRKPRICFSGIDPQGKRRLAVLRRKPVTGKRKRQAFDWLHPTFINPRTLVRGAPVYPTQERLRELGEVEQLAAPQVEHLHGGSAPAQGLAVIGLEPVRLEIAALLMNKPGLPLCLLLWDTEGRDFDYPTLRNEREGWGTRRLVAG
jgi:hypothetical protein